MTNVSDAASCAVCGGGLTAEPRPATSLVTAGMAGMGDPGDPDAPRCLRCEKDRQHLYALFCSSSDGLGFCGCGRPEDAYDLVRQILALAPFYEHRDELRALLPDDGVFYFTLYQLDRAGLLEHGGSVGGSWLTEKGKYYAPLMQAHEWDAIGGAGFPHDGQDCTPECRHWRGSRSEYDAERDAKARYPQPVPNDDRECGCAELRDAGSLPPGATIVATTSHDGSVTSAFGLYTHCPHHGKTASFLWWASRRAFAGEQL